jgi:uracil-DNA glycosylase
MNPKHLVLHECMRKLHPEWKKIFYKHKGKFISILEKICASKNVTPSIENILEPFMLNPNHIKVVIIGQDPYPKKGEANGLCFSTNADVCPIPLKNVLNAIGYKDTSDSSLFDFHNYLYQGVLLLNISLTTEVGENGKHTSIWKQFVKNIISAFTKFNKTTITFMLWGNDAMKIKEHIASEHTVLEWETSPMLDKFNKCDHFQLTSNKINWKCLGDNHTIYTDGAVKMGEPCIAGYGIFFGGGILEGVEINGKVKPFKYKLKNGVIEVLDTESCLCTSQRGEYLALCYTMMICLNINLPSPIKIVSDSRNALMTMQEWYAKKKDKTKFGNYDLVVIMCTLFDKLSSIKDVELIHINSHQKDNTNIAVRCNNHVDKLAKEALKFNSFETKFNSDVLMFI